MELSLFLSHPFVLLITGAIISSILVPLFSKKWQDRKKKLEIKIELITKISEVVSSWELDTLALLHSKDPPSEPNPNWRVKGSPLTAILYTYFPSQPIYEKWKKYFNVIDQYWWFSNTTFHGEMKEEYQENLDIFKDLLGEESEEFNLDIFFNIKNSKDTGKSGMIWSNVTRIFVKKQYDIISLILDSKITAF